MNNQTLLAEYTAEELAGLSPAKLTDILIENEDRAPRNVIDECVRRDEAMVAHLRMLHEDDFLWQPDDGSGDVGVWWLRLHAAMILGLIPTESAGLLLVELMRRMSEENDDDLQDWLSGYWPALFRNKPESVLPALRKMCADKKLGCYIRANAIDAVVARASWQSGEALDHVLAWLAGIVANEDEEWDLRLLAGNTLLDFARPEYRELLEEMAKRQGDLGVHFSEEDVQHAYAELLHQPEWEREHFKNPWGFYEPDEITKRQQRWREEDVRENADDFDDDFDFPDYGAPEPYIRPEPKVGRNDPCPCGSGKKYKKCCLAKE